MYKFGYIHCFQTGAWFHPLVPWKTVIGTLKQKPLAVASFLSHTQLPEMSFYFLQWLSFCHLCRRFVAILQSPGVCSWLPTRTLCDFHTWSISGFNLFWTYDAFCSSDVECLPTGFISISTISLHMVYWHIFAAWAQDISMYCSPPFNILQHWYWWLAAYFQEHPGVALSTGHGHICSQPQLGNEGVPGVTYGNGPGWNRFKHQVARNKTCLWWDQKQFCCRREVSTLQRIELRCQGL